MKVRFEATETLRHVVELDFPEKEMKEFISDVENEPDILSEYLNRKTMQDGDCELDQWSEVTEKAEIEEGK